MFGGGGLGASGAIHGMEKLRLGSRGKLVYGKSCKASLCGWADGEKQGAEGSPEVGDEGSALGGSCSGWVAGLLEGKEVVIGARGRGGEKREVLKGKLVEHCPKGSRGHVVGAKPRGNIVQME